MNAHPSSNTHRWGIAGLVIGTLLIMAGSSRAAPADFEDQEQLRAMLLGSLQASLAEIESAELKICEVREDRSVSAIKTVTRDVSDGKQVTVTRAPQVERDIRVIWQGEDLRVDRYPITAQRNANAVDHWSFVDGVWTQFTPGETSAWILRTRDLPGMFPIDPRRVGTDDIQRSLEEILAQDRLINMQFGHEPGGSALIALHLENADGVSAVYEFAEADSYLPRRFYTRWPGSSSVLQVVDYEYQSVLDGKATVLQKLSRRFYDRGVTRKPDSPRFRQRMTREVEVVALNQTIPQERFVISFPPGTRISDNTQQRIYVTAGTLRGEPGSKWPHVVALVGVVVALISLRARKNQFAH